MALAACEIVSSDSDTFENGSLSNDNIDLLQAQERELAILEAMNRKLVSERDKLSLQCQMQAEKIRSLESIVVTKTTVRQQQPIAIDDLPMFDAAEFLPVEDLPVKETAMQRFKRVSADLLIKK